eukprot:3895672-Prymnesium_polylepis.1
MQRAGQTTHRGGAGLCTRVGERPQQHGRSQLGDIVMNCPRHVVLRKIEARLDFHRRCKVLPCGADRARAVPFRRHAGSVCHRLRPQAVGSRSAPHLVVLCNNPSVVDDRQIVVPRHAHLLARRVSQALGATRQHDDDQRLWKELAQAANERLVAGAHRPWVGRVRRAHVRVVPPVLRCVVDQRVQEEHVRPARLITPDERPHSRKEHRGRGRLLRPVDCAHVGLRVLSLQPALDTHRVRAVMPLPFVLVTADADGERAAHRSECDWAAADELAHNGTRARCRRRRQPKSLLDERTSQRHLGAKGGGDAVGRIQ